MEKSNHDRVGFGLYYLAPLPNYLKPAMKSLYILYNYILPFYDYYYSVLYF